MPSFSGTVSGPVPPRLRLDRYIADCLNILSRSQIKARQMRARVNGKEAKKSCLLKPGDVLELFWKEAESENLIPEDLPLDIIFENERVVVINKKQGMVVHPGAGNRQGTLANALLFRMLKKNTAINDSGPPGEAFRPGIVHRLDKDTSGVMIAAYDDGAMRFLSDQFQAREVKKMYAAIVQGIPESKSGRIETRIIRDIHDRKRFMVSDEKGRPALTFYKVIRVWRDYALLALRPKTGRTHQLRLHMKYLGHPIAGDPVYGGRGEKIKTLSLMLHARNLTITLPNNTEPGMFKAPLPQRFYQMVKILEGMW
jgi:23S rRNA pseudouridine1911/1915/1917 synthase